MWTRKYMKIHMKYMNLSYFLLIWRYERVHLCMYACMYVRAHVCVYVFVHTHMHTEKWRGVKLNKGTKSKLTFEEDQMRRELPLQKIPIIFLVPPDQYHQYKKRHFFCCICISCPTSTHWNNPTLGLSQQIQYTCFAWDSWNKMRRYGGLKNKAKEPILEEWRSSAQRMPDALGRNIHHGCPVQLILIVYLKYIDARI